MSRVLLWWQAIRPFAFTVSLIPPLLGGIIAMIDNPGMKPNIFRLALTAIGCMTAHAGANLLSDYYDFKARVDRVGAFGSSGLLVSGAMAPSGILRGAWTAFFTAALIGAYLVCVTPGRAFLVGLVLMGGGLAVFYTAAPVALKYRALGDMAVFLAFGPAMVLGAYYVQAHRFSWVPVLYALPIALLVDAVLHSNNLRDMENDRAVNIKTVPILIGLSRAKAMYCGLVFGAYAVILMLIGLAGLTPFSLLVFLSLPLAMKLTKGVMRKESIPAERFAAIDAATAQLHLFFGVLMILSLAIQFGTNGMMG